MFVAFAWTLLIVGACLFPGRWLPGHESQPGISHLDKLVHGSLFAVYGLLWMRAGRRRAWTWKAWVVAAGIVLALLTELGQGLPAIERDPDPLDGLADVAGLIVGLGLFRVLEGPAGRPAAG
jgi:hypothetical protein